MQTFYLALDLINDPKSIAEYEAYHQAVWPEVIEQMQANGIVSCKIFRVFNRMVMELKTTDAFSFEAKNKSDAQLHIIQDWETLMWQYQQAIPGTATGEKWQLMQEIFCWEERS